MPFVARHKWTWDEVAAAIVLLDPLFFALAFWGEDLTIPESRIDLPASWRGQQIITKEQRMMAYDGAVYRLWRDQAPILAQDSSQMVSMRTSRKIAKTLFMEAAIIQVAITNTQSGITEGMVHTPRDNHMAPLRNRVEKKLDTIPLFNAMRSSFNRDTGIMNFRNGWVWHFRIEGGSNTGTNMVGLRAYTMIGDEADYSQEAAYNERGQTALPGCAQMWGGVPRGVRGVFWRICNTSEGKAWSVHRYDMRANPLYHSAKAFNDQVGGDWYSQRVQTQVLGRDGEEAVTSFPVIPIDNFTKYVVRKFSLPEYQSFKESLPAFLNLPISDVKDAESWMIHLDYGYSPSPTQLGVSYLKLGVWHVICRIEMMRIDNTPMAHVISVIDQQILPQRASLIVMDAHGQGRGVLSALHEDPRWEAENYVTRAVAVGFEGTTPTPGVKVHKRCRQIVRQDHDNYWTCDACLMRIFDDSELTDGVISTKVFLTNGLKEAFANGQKWIDSQGNAWPGGVAIVIGDDVELNEELSGTTEIQSQGGSTRYVTPHDADHMTDMLRCAVSGAERYRTMTTDYDEFSPDLFGWSDAVLPGGEEGNWTPPWAN